MTTTSSLTGCFLALGVLLASAAPAASPPSLSVEQIVQKNIEARGGLAAWRAVQTLTFEGQLDAGGKPPHEVPFVLRQKRPHKTRLEIVFQDQAAVQIFDGTQGWKVRPFLNRNDVEVLTPEEVRSEADSDELDGPLLDYARKGTQVALAGTDTVEGHAAYKLRLTLRDGSTRDLWIDAASFLELKREGEPRKLDGRPHKVESYSRDYRMEHGLNLPHLQETVVEGVKEPYKMTIRKVAVNESLDEALFQKPQLTAAAAPAPVDSSPGARAATASAPAAKHP